jgi:acetolactate synthase-1/2/3 large subunit
MEPTTLTKGITNADLIARTLREAGVRYCFGIPSGQVLPLIEAMRRAGIEYVLVSHEGAAGFMADVVGRLTGVPGVCLATLGPGATNMTTGVGNALLDRSPLLAITGQVPVAQLKRRVQMRIDQQDLFRPLTKATFMAEPGRVTATVREAMRLACAEPPGPVHLDLPEDVALAPPAEPLRDLTVAGAALLPLTGGLALAGVGRMLQQARRPVAALGFSVFRTGQLEALRRFLEGQNLPFVTTMMAKGAVPEDHPLWVGVIGRARRKTVETFLARADLVIGIGYDPVEINYEEWMPKVPLVHLDGEPADVDGTVNVAHQVVGDLASTLVGLESLPPRANHWKADELAAFRAHLEASLRLAPGDGFQPWEALDLLREALPRDAIVTCDVGAHTHLVATQWRTYLPHTLLVSNGWSSMGYGIPAALGAKLACPDREVACIMGDGCLLMMAGEMATARRLGRKVLFLVLNDNWLALIKVKQERRKYGLTGVQLGETNYSPPDQYFGVPCRATRTPAEFRAALQWARAVDGPAVVEAMVRPEIYSEILYG